MTRDVMHAGQVEDRLRLLAVTAFETRASEFDELLDDFERDVLVRGEGRAGEWRRGTCW